MDNNTKALVVYKSRQKCFNRIKSVKSIIDRFLLFYFRKHKALLFFSAILYYLFLFLFSCLIFKNPLNVTYLSQIATLMRHNIIKIFFLVLPALSALVIIGKYISILSLIYFSLINSSLLVAIFSCYTNLYQALLKAFTAVLFSFISIIYVASSATFDMNLFLSQSNKSKLKTISLHLLTSTIYVVLIYYLSK